MASVYVPEPRVLLRAVALADSALHGRPPMPVSRFAVRAQWLLYHPVYEGFITVLLVAQLTLGFWELPSKYNIAGRDQGFATSLIAELAILLVVAADAVLVQRPAYGPARWLKRGWVRTKLVAFGLTLTNLIITFATNGMVPYVCVVIRPLLLLERKQNLRKVAKSMASALPNALVSGILVVTNLLLWAVATFVLFSGMDGDNCETFFSREPRRCSYFTAATGTLTTSSCREFFSSLENSMAHLLELQSGAGYPVLFLPLMRCHPLIALFFVCNYLLSTFLILNMTLAATNSALNTQREKEVLLRFTRSLAGLQLSFCLLTGSTVNDASELLKVTGGSEGWDRGDEDDAAAASSTVRAVNPLSAPGGEGGGEGGGGAAATEAPPTGARLSREMFQRFFSQLRPAVDIAAAGLFFDVFDAHKTGFIDVVGFQRLMMHCGRLRVIKTRTRSKRAAPAPLPSALGGAAAAAAPDWGLGFRPKSAWSAAEGDDRRLSQAPRFATMAGDDDFTPDLLVPGVEVLEDAPLGPPKAAPGGAACEGSDEEGGGKKLPAVELGVVPAGGAPPSAPPPPPPSAKSSSEKLASALYGYFDADLPPEMAVRHGVPMDISRDSWRGRVLTFLHYWPVHVFLELMSLTNVIAVLVQISFESFEMTDEDYKQIYTLKTVQFVTFAFYVAEVFGALVALGPRRFFKLTPWNTFDVLVVLSASATIALECCYDQRTHALVLGIMFLRCAKILRVMKAVPGFSALVTSILSVVPAIWRFMAVLGLLLYAAAALGVLLFRGNLEIDYPAYQQLGLQELNFDNLGSALFTMTAMAGPWWVPVMEAIVVRVNSYTPRGYFYFLWFASLVLGNFTFAFIMDAFSVQRRLHAAKKAMTAAAEEHGHGHGHGQGGDHGGGHGHDENDAGGPSSMWWRERLQAHHNGTLVKKTVMGLFDWRNAFLESGVSFKGWRVLRKPHHGDAEEEVYAPLLRQVFSQLLHTDSAAPQKGGAGHHDD